MRPVYSWLVSVAATCVCFALLARSDWNVNPSNVALFWFTIAVTASCAVFALGLITMAHRVGQPELGVLGAGLFAASIFPFVHGLNIPGVLISEPTAATSFAAWLGLPAALVVVTPAVFDVPGRRFLLRHWSGFTNIALAVVVLVTLALLVAPNTVPAARPDALWSTVGAGMAFTGAQVLAGRQIRLYEIGRRIPSLWAGIGFSWLGMSSLLWLVGSPSQLIVWVAHGLDGFGVLAAAGGLILAHRNDGAVTEVLAPVLNRDPAMALRLGVTPQIAQFITALDSKDHNTAGHVTRVAELALRLGERAGFTGARLRTLGLGALLHDIGKTEVPDEILTKPGALTDDEFGVMKQHTIWGEEILAVDSVLAPVSKLVRSHHERADGRGYPDGLAGATIPLDVSLVSVADAWDAMVQTRHYRTGMDELAARQIFAANAGRQWSTEAVEILMTHLDSDIGTVDLFGDLVADHGVACCSDLVQELTSESCLDSLDLPAVRRIRASV